MESARRSAAAQVVAECNDQWLAIDSVLTSLKERSRSYAQTDDREEMEVVVASPRGRSAEEARLRGAVEALTAERDRLRARVVKREQQLRHTLRAYAQLAARTNTMPPPEAGRAAWLLWVLARGPRPADPAPAPAAPSGSPVANGAPLRPATRRPVRAQGVRPSQAD